MKMQLQIIGQVNINFKTAQEFIRDAATNCLGRLNKEKIILKNVRIMDSIMQGAIIPEMIIEEKKAIIIRMTWNPDGAKVEMVVDPEDWQCHAAFADRVKKDFTYYWLKIGRFFGFYKNLFNRGDLIHSHKIIEIKNYDIYEAVSFEPLLSRFAFDWQCKTVIQSSELDKII